MNARVRLGLCSLYGLLYVLGAGQHGFGWQDKSRDCYHGLYCRLDQGMKTALVLRELQSQDAGEKLSTDPS